MKKLPKYPTKAKPTDLKKKKSFWKKPLLIIAVLFVGLILAFTDWSGDPASNNKVQQGGDTATPIEAVGNPNTATRQSTNAAGGTVQSQQPSTNTTAPTTSKAGCDWRGDIPYKTVEKTTSSMAVGQVKVIDGVNGWHKVCTDEQGNTVSDTVTQEPMDKIIYYGTYTSEQALSKARSICGGVPANSTFYADCVAREMNKQGWYWQDNQWVYR